MGLFYKKRHNLFQAYFPHILPNKFPLICHRIWMHVHKFTQKANT